MNDPIEREDAIKAIEQLPNAYNGWSDTYDKAYIIGTLEELPSAKMDGEYIRREDAVRASWEALYDYQDEMETKFRESDDVEFRDWFIHRIFVQGVHGEILNRIVDIPSAEPKQGEWIKTSDDWIDGYCGARYFPIHCSVCNYSTYDDSATNYCPNCGSRNRKENE